MSNGMTLATGEVRHAASYRHYALRQGDSDLRGKWSGGDRSAGSGKPVEEAQIVVAPPENAASMSDEAYADWAAYLNDFAAEHPELRFERIVREALDEALADPPQLSEEYAAIFVRSDGRAAFYDGMILEPFVYDEGADFVAGRVSIPEYLELRE